MLPPPPEGGPGAVTPRPTVVVVPPQVRPPDGGFVPRRDVRDTHGLSLFTSTQTVSVAPSLLETFGLLSK